MTVLPTKPQAAEVRDERIRQLAAQGLTGRVIALRLGVSMRTVWRALKVPAVA